MACEYCAEAIALEQPCMEFMCRHKVHTECALREMVAHEPLHNRCPSCREFIIPRQLMEEAEAVHGDDGQREVIRYFWDHEPDFKAGLVSLRDSRVSAQRAATLLGRKEKELKAKLEEDVAPLVAQIQEKVAATKAAHKTLPEKKEADMLSRKYMTKLTHFTKRWGVRMWRIQNALQDVAAIRSLVGNMYGIYRRRRYRSDRAFNISID